MSTPNKVLLLGAGFSRNWNGWLASEIDEFLTGCQDVDSYARGLLMHPSSKGFEHILDGLQVQQSASLKGFEVGIRKAFEKMNAAFGQLTGIDFSNDVDLTVRKFLARFDAIFTLNQDDLLEMHYVSLSPELLSGGRFDGAAVMGARRDPNAHALEKTPRWLVDNAAPALSTRVQPYIKLHGSANWSSGGGQLLVVGGSKTSAIAKHPVLAWGMKTFEQFLSTAHTRLMVIGYGFRDGHINKAILDAAQNSPLKIFIVDPQGYEVVNWECKGGAIPARSALFQKFEPLFQGVSRRPLSSTFGPADRAEHEKLMDFLA